MRIHKEKSQCLEAWEKYERRYVIKEHVPDAVWDTPIIRPEKPKNYKKIVNYGNKKVDRKFPYYSNSFIKMMEEKGKSSISSDKLEYSKFIKEEWRRRYEGLFFYNGDILEYITGRHYCTLQYWKIQVTTTIDGVKRKRRLQPFFRDNQRDAFYAMRSARLDNKSAGICYISNRRSGKSNSVMSEGYWDTTENPEAIFAIQSKTEKDAKKVFKKVIDSWSRVPYWFKPQDTEETTQASKLYFGDKKQSGVSIQERDDSTALNSLIYPENSKEEALDGEYASFIMNDECLLTGEEVVMGDFSYKKVEDLKIGDLLMGVDGSPRKVIKRIDGYAESYEIEISGDRTIRCTGNHILSLVYSNRGHKMTFKGRKYDFGDVVNLTVDEYLKLNQSDKKHSVCYMPETMEFNEKELPLDPYLLGLWLGGGSCSGASITSIDTEIINYLDENYDVSITPYKKNNDLKSIYIRGIRGILYKEDFIRNKHIPNTYLKSSVSQRRELLAGLLDSDGYKVIHSGGGVSASYEIVQKRKNLIDDINILCKSLGLGCSYKKKVATMKRDGKPTYKCDVYRLAIHGETWNIPCKVKRKITQKPPFNKNRRNALRKGIRNITPIGVNKFHGFTLDGDNLFLTKDFLVTHNCGKSSRGLDVNERWNINRECLMDGADIIGFGACLSTVEDMDKYGSASFKILWDRSDSKVRLPNGMTKSYLQQFFLPAYYGFVGEEEGVSFVDEWGYSDIPAAMKYHQKYYDALDGEDLMSYQRKYPSNINHCWVTSDGINNFSTRRLLEQKIWNDSVTDINPVRGNFMWRNGIKWGTVDFYPDPQGRWEVAWQPDELDRNRFETTMGGQKKPTRDFCVTGIDPFSHGKVVDEKQGSNGAAVTILKNYPTSDIKEGVVCIYDYRQSDPNAQVEDLIMQCCYYSSPALIESNISVGVNGFRDKGYYGYVEYNPLETDKRKIGKGLKGYATTSKENVENLISMSASYILDVVGKREDGSHGFVPFNALIEQWMNFTPEKRGPFDLVMAGGLAIILARAPRQKTISNFNADDWMPKVSSAALQRLTAQVNQAGG